MKPIKKADAQAKKNHALYVAIAKYFPNVMIAVVNADFRIVFMEGEELQKIGLDKITIEGKLISETGYFSSQWRKNMKAYAQKTFEGKNFTYESIYRDHIYRVNTMPLHDERQQINMVLFVYSNITEQKNTEMEMFKALKKERELGELKSRFVSMASHEFRTPLSTILSAANLIARQNEPGNEGERLRNVERIRSSVKNLIDILNEFLSLGHLEEGKISAKKEVFDIVDFMKTIIQELQHAQKPGQQVHIFSRQPVIQVNLDKQFIRNIFLNLLSNALKYSPEGKPVDIIFTTQAKAISIQVIDQGVGIPEDEHKHLFDLFFRARNATNIQGTGLGLPIVKKYIDLMQGDIAVESQLDKGTTFTITLPLEQINQSQA